MKNSELQAGYSIQKVESRKLYEGLRDLWCRVFGDEPEFVDAMYSAFGADIGSPEQEPTARTTAGVPAVDCSSSECLAGPAADISDIAGYVVTDSAGKVVSALTCYRCGIYRAEEFGYDEYAEDAGQGSYSSVFDNHYEHSFGENDGTGSENSSVSPYEMFASLDGMPVYVSYAVCTDPDYRGLGLAGKLTEYVRDLVTEASGSATAAIGSFGSAGSVELVVDSVSNSTGSVPSLLHYPGGAISLVSPADGSLIRFYKEHGYVPHFYSSEGVAFGSGADPLGGSYGDPFGDPFGGAFDDSFADPFGGAFGDPFYDPEDEELLEEGFGSADVYEWGEDDGEFEAFDPGLTVQATDAETYNRYREAFLAGKPHIELSSRMIEFIRAESMDGDGLLVINGGDAICTLVAMDDGSEASDVDPSKTGNTNTTSITTGDSYANRSHRRILVAELLINPMLMEFSMEIDMVIAAKLAQRLGVARLSYRIPGRDYCQAMIATEHSRSEGVLAETNVAETNTAEKDTAEKNTAGKDTAKKNTAGMDTAAEKHASMEKNAPVALPYDPYEVPQSAYFGFPID